MKNEKIFEAGPVDVLYRDNVSNEAYVIMGKDNKPVAVCGSAKSATNFCIEHPESVINSNSGIQICLCQNKTKEEEPVLLWRYNPTGFKTLCMFSIISGLVSIGATYLYMKNVDKKQK